MATKKKPPLFRCPKCGATPSKHGKGGEDACVELNGRRSVDCTGILCECFQDAELVRRSDEPDHGESFTNPCEHANCYHCGWCGTLPAKPKGLAPWEKKALEAGWSPPPDRASELGLGAPAPPATKPRKKK